MLLVEQERGAGLAELDDHLEELLDEERRKPEGELVDHQELRARHHGPRHREHLLLTSGERPSVIVELLLQDGEQPEQSLAVLLHPRGTVSPHDRAEVEVLAHRQCRKDPASFGQMPETERSTAVRRHVVLEDPPVELDDAAPRRQEAGDRPQRRGLAGPVGTEQGDDLTLCDVERHAVQHLDAPVAAHESLNSQQQRRPPDRPRSRQGHARRRRVNPRR